MFQKSVLHFQVKSSSVHINPRFHQKLKNSATPVASQSAAAQSKSSATPAGRTPQAAATPQNVHINPNFAARYTRYSYKMSICTLGRYLNCNLIFPYQKSNNQFKNK